MASTPLHSEVLAANAEYVASFGVKADLPLPPGRKAAFLVCMDARINPAAALGIKEGARGKRRDAFR